jgi:hypothetical protein
MINHPGHRGVRTYNVISKNTFDTTTSFISVATRSDPPAIHFDGARGTTFSSNVVRTDVGLEAVYLQYSTYNAFLNNVFSDVRSERLARPCVYLTLRSSRNTFQGNRFVSACHWGCVVVMQHSAGNRFIRNSFDISGGHPFYVERGLSVYRRGNRIL